MIEPLVPFDLCTLLHTVWYPSFRAIHFSNSPTVVGCIKWYIASSYNLTGFQSLMYDQSEESLKEIWDWCLDYYHWNGGTEERIALTKNPDLMVLKWRDNTLTLTYRGLLHDWSDDD